MKPFPEFILLLLMIVYSLDQVISGQVKAPTKPKKLIASLEKLGDIQITWKAPFRRAGLVNGYKIYVSELNVSKNSTYEVGKDEEEFTLSGNLTKVGATYTIWVVALYTVGKEKLESKPSRKVEIKIPLLDAPMNVKAESQMNSLLVSWDPPAIQNKLGVDGYTVFYNDTSPGGNLSGEVNVTKSGPGGSSWYVYIKLPGHRDYNIQVAAFTGSPKETDKKSDPITWRHYGFSSEISLRATLLKSDTAMVTVNTLGPSVVENLRVLVTDEHKQNWERIEKFTSYDPMTSFVIKEGLKPETHYFFWAKGIVNNRTKRTVTHLITPPDYKANIQVNVTVWKNKSALVTWEPEEPQPVGYSVKLMMKFDHGNMIVESSLAMNKTEYVVQDLVKRNRYIFCIIPFDHKGLGTPSYSRDFILPEAPEAQSVRAEKKDWGVLVTWTALKPQPSSYKVEVLNEVLPGSFFTMDKKEVPGKTNKVRLDSEDLFQGNYRVHVTSADDTEVGSSSFTIP